MATFYNGVPTNVALVGSTSIASSTNATPIVVTTAAVHGLTDGDIVEITGHATNYSANGVWRVTVLTSTTFSLQSLAGTNTVGVGVGGATGTVAPLSDGQYQIITDGEQRNAANYNVPLEALGDRTAYALYRLAKSGTKLLNQRNQLTNSFSGVSAWSSFTATNVTWAEQTDVSTALGSNLDVNAVDLDVVEFEFKTSINSGVSNAVAFGIFVHAYEHGASPSFASATLLPDSVAAVGFTAAAGGAIPIHLTGGFSMIGAGSPKRGQKVRFYVATYGWGGAGFSMQFVGNYSALSRVWR